tara:strand:+ start:302 stop:472 length:171 start_codon:yes stop_codon:yes gene_type:complete
MKKFHKAKQSSNRDKRKNKTNKRNRRGISVAIGSVKQKRDPQGGMKKISIFNKGGN